MSKAQQDVTEAAHTTGLVQTGVLVHTDPLVQAGVTFPWELLITPSTQGDYRHRMAYLATPSLILYRERQDTPMHARGMTPANHFTLIIPLRRVPDTAYYKRADQSLGLPCALPREASGIIGRGNEQLVIMAHRSLLDRHLTEEQQRLMHWADQAHYLPLPRSTVESLSAWVCRVIRQALAFPRFLSHHEELRSLEEDFAQFLCSALDQMAPKPIKRPSPPLRALALKRALEYLHGTENTELSIPDLCQFIGVHQRTLEYSFQDTFCLSPLGYLRLKRLHAAREMLMSGRIGEMTVATAACQNGFFELGRFSALYAKTFGEKPSVTLSRQYTEIRSVLAAY